MKPAPCAPKTLEESLLLMAWIAGDDTGLSSKHLFRYMTGVPTDGGPFAPADLDDFGRCSRLVRRFPQFRAHLDAFALDSGIFQWRNVTKNWDALDELLELAQSPNASATVRNAAWREANRLISKGAPR